MNAVSKITAEKPTGLDLLREPFPAHQISKLPKPTKAQTDDVRTDFKKGMRCPLCNSWHHPQVVHLDYVGHAALTDRLLDADPNWSWEPAALRDGLPAFDNTGGLWIKLTVCGVTRLGYGHAAPKEKADPGAREKEVIGDALRNAAMRFGAALDLWHKGDLHADAGGDEDAPRTTPAAVEMAINLLKGCGDASLFKQSWESNKHQWHGILVEDDFKRVVAVKDELVIKWKAEKEKQQSLSSQIDSLADEIPF